MLIILLLLGASSGADEAASTSTPIRQYTNFKPYVPEKTDYRFELGGMWEERSLYWMGFGLGFHTGRCMFTQSETCQQYIDTLVGVGGREGQTNGLLMVGPRWQFVNFPRAISPSVRLLVGMMDVRDNSRNQEFFAAAVGYGITASVHERVDLHIEMRAGTADKGFGQIFIGADLKMEKWLEYFADRMKALGIGAAEMTGSALHTVIGKPVQKAAEALTGKSDKKKPTDKQP